MTYQVIVFVRHSVGQVIVKYEADATANACSSHTEIEYSEKVHNCCKRCSQVTRTKIQQLKSNLIVTKKSLSVLRSA